MESNPWKVCVIDARLGGETTRPAAALSRTTFCF